MTDDNIYYLYILECSNNSLYTGYTTDIKRRYQEHSRGSAKCKYTRSFPPKCIAACWQFGAAEKGEILSLEKTLKKLSRLQKQQLILEPEELIQHSSLVFTVHNEP
jgi:putative endonuclease